MSVLLLVAAVVLVSLFFAFTNGIHDASSIVATPIACGALSPRMAVLFAGAVGFAGALLGGSAVANTIGGLVTHATDEGLVTLLLAAVLAASIWNLITWRLRLPSSSTHALIGGLIGAAVAASGTGSVRWGWDELVGPAHHLVGLAKVIAFLIASIVLGLVLGFLIHKASTALMRGASRKVNGPIRRTQLMTAAIVAFGHGANDTQKQMGVMVLALAAGGYVASPAGIPLWVRASAGFMLALGTVGGGWGIMRTIGRRIFKLEPIHSLDSQVATSVSLIGSTLAGAPVSSTQVVAASIVGVGAAENARMVQWSVGKEIMAAFLLTIPAAIALSVVLYYVLAWAV